MSQSLSSNAEKIAISRYFMEDENWETCTSRVANVVSSIEKESAKYKELFHQIIFNMDFLPAGRILRNAGRIRGSMMNCYLLPVEDSIESIGEFLKNALILWSEGGGVGCSFSNLRPVNFKITGKGGKSSGMVSFIKAADGVAATVESGGSRRAAGLISVDIRHPEIIDFINTKIKDKQIPHFNISVGVTHDFLKAVEQDGDWEYKFNQQSCGSVKAVDLWDLILRNMISYAEPGLLNYSNLTKNNSFYFNPILGTNPCGEASLGAYESCDLGSLVLPNFIMGQGKTNWKKLEDVIQLSVRFLDNVIDINKYVLKEIDLRTHDSRKIGLGVMGMAEYLFLKQVRYGAAESLLEIEKLMKFIRDTVYITLISLAVEKGAFPKFDPIMYGHASFIRKLPAAIRKEIKAKGVRCATGLAIAPTGTIALLPEVSGGIEPLFAKAHIRKDRVSKRYYVHPTYLQLIENANLIENKELPNWFVDSFDLKPQDHLEVQSLVQRYIDGSVSKTINLPKETTAEQLSGLLFEYIYDLKGVTVYRDGSKEGQVLNRVSHEEVLKAIKSGKGIDEEIPEEATKCATGSCEI